MKQKKDPSKTKSIILSIAIAIVLSAFVLYLTQSIYPKPNYEDYCDVMYPKTINQSQEDYNSCRTIYNEAEENYKFTVFLVTIITGLISISSGILIHLTSVSTGLMLGGTFLTFVGTAVYWNNLSHWFKTIILGIVLGILIWLGYKKMKI